MQILLANKNKLNMKGRDRLFICFQILFDISGKEINYWRRNANKIWEERERSLLNWKEKQN